MRQALSLTHASNELMRCCLLRRQHERLFPTFYVSGHLCHGFSLNERILLANPLQSSRSTFSRGSFLSFFAFQEGMLGTPISLLGGWPTVIHDTGLSTAYENREAIFRRIPHALSCTTTHENKTALRYAGATTSLHSRRGYAGAPCQIG